MHTDRHPRVSAALLYLVESDGRRMPVRAADLSLTGCRFEGLGSRPSSPVTVEIPARDPVRARARIVRAERRDDGLWDVALAFQDLDWAGICAVARHLAPWLDSAA
jgi:hypothetical protein